MRIFSERLAHDVGISRDTPCVLLVSKADEIGMQEPPDLGALRNHISGLGFPVSVVIASAFSRCPNEVKSGTGVFEAFSAILSHRVTEDREELPAPANGSGRSFQRFRG